MFLETQMKNPVKEDWFLTVMEDLESLKIHETIKKMTKSTFKGLIEKKVVITALIYLNSEKEKHTKVAHIEHKNLEMQDYLSPNTISIQESKFIFLLRTRMLDVRNNYKGRSTVQQ